MLDTSVFALPKLFFSLIVVIFVVKALVVLWTWHKNNQSPLETEMARLVAKRQHISGGGDAPTSTSYFLTFEFADSRRQEFRVSATEFSLLVEEDQGTLTYQGTRYIGFER